MDAKTLSFSVNGRECGVAFTDIDVSEKLCPVVILSESGDSVTFCC